MTEIQERGVQVVSAVVEAPAETSEASMTTPIRQMAQAARSAQRRMMAASAAQRTEALSILGSLLSERAEEILAANRLDLDAAAAEKLTPVLRNRLALSRAKIEGLAAGVEQLAESEDPIGAIRRRTELDDGLVLTQVDSPIGVILVIFESRPDALIQIGSLGLRTGNAMLLKGGREAAHSNAILAECLRQALAGADLPQDALLLVSDRREVHDLLGEDDCIDLVVPRGSGELVRKIQGSTRIPVLGHAEGICHLYLDRAADPGMAMRLAVDGKCDYPAACNATETLLVHKDFLSSLAGVGIALKSRGVSFKADTRAAEWLPDAEPAGEGDFATEWGDLTLSVRVVDSMDEAIAHIEEFGSGHTEAIVTADELAARRFLARVDAASVFVNASTRFADGYRYGLGAEVGISTSRIHARGPVGAEGLMTTKWQLVGSGQVVSDYGPGKRAFLHRQLRIDSTHSPVR